MTNADYDKAIAANRARAAVSYSHHDNISGDHWSEQAAILEAEREQAAQQSDRRDGPTWHYGDDVPTGPRALTLEAELGKVMAARINAIPGSLDARDHCVTFDVLKGSPDHTLTHG